MRSGLLLLLVAVLAADVCAQSISVHEDRLNWYSSNHDEIQTALTQENELVATPLVHLVCAMWEAREGAGGSEVAPAIARAMIYHPDLTLRWFREYREVFEAWIDRLPFDLLTDYSGEMSSELESLRSALVGSPSDFALQSEDESLAETAISVARKAEDNRVRQID